MTDQPVTPCRRCLLMEAFPADYRKYVASVLATLRPDRKTDDETYRRRLAACKACEQLDRGTCMGCGCLVELRAADRRQRCPYSKWI